MKMFELSKTELLEMGVDIAVRTIDKIIRDKLIPMECEKIKADADLIRGIIVDLQEAIRYLRNHVEQW